MPSVLCYHFIPMIPLTTTLPPPTGFFLLTLQRIIRSWYVNVLSLPFAGWSLPLSSPSLHRWTNITDTGSGFYLIVTYFKYPLTTLCTLVWQPETFLHWWPFTRVLLIIYLFECHWVRQAAFCVSPKWHLQWIGFCRVKMTWPRGYWVSHGPHLIIPQDNSWNSTEVEK